MKYTQQIKFIVIYNWEIGSGQFHLSLNNSSSEHQTFFDSEFDWYHSLDIYFCSSNIDLKMKTTWTPYKIITRTKGDNDHIS